MKKFICTVCGYVYEGEEAPEFCPQCKVPRSKFKELVETEGALTFADEHVIGVAKGVDAEVLEGSTVTILTDELLFCKQKKEIYQKFCKEF